VQQQRNASQPQGQQSSVFLTEQQVQVLTQELGFDEQVINQGQQVLYASLSQRDLMPDGVTIYSGGSIDLEVTNDIQLHAGIGAADELWLSTQGNLDLGNNGFFDSEHLLGLSVGGDFSTNRDLSSANLLLDIGGNFSNNASLTGTELLSISSGKSLLNQGTLSGGTVWLDAGTDLINQGRIQGSNVGLQAGGDIINRTEFSQHTIKNGENSQTYTIVGTAPQIISTDSLSMNAGNNLDLQGSKLSAAGDISLSAGKDVLLGAVEKVFGSEKYFKGGYDISYDRTYDVVSLQAGGNLSVAAGNNLQSEGAQFSAGGIAALSAGNELNLLAVTESHYDADKTTKKSTFKKKVTETVTHQEEVQGSSITADNILLNATVDENGQVSQLTNGNITMVGSVLDAKQNIIGFGNDITLTAGTYQDYAYSHTSKSSFGGLKSKSREELAQDALLSGSTLSAGGTISLDAGNNLSILASHLDGGNIGLTAFNDLLIASGEESSIREVRTKSGGFLSGGSLFSSSEALNGVAKITADSSTLNATGNLVIDAGSATVIGSKLNADKGMQISTDIGDINVLAAKETEQSYQYTKEMSIGLGDVLKAFSNPVDMAKNMLDGAKDSGRLSFTLANADYLESETTTSILAHKGSELTAGANLVLNSISNISIAGSQLAADADGNGQGALGLTAGQNINVLDVTDTFNQRSETTQGSAEVNLMVTHQAAEVANAAKAAEAAAEQLEDTRRNYKAWQQQQDNLTAQIATLEQELAQGKPGVTQADIDDVRTQLDILKTDEAWHLANIAVAVDNAATATKALYQQGLATANSTTTLGFNAGLELNVSATHTKTQVQDSYSVGSVLSGRGVYLKTGDDGQLLVKGSAIDSSGAMALNVGSLVMQAGVNTHDSSTQTQQGNLNISQTVWGAAAGGPVVNASYNQSEQRDHSTSYTNASLTAADSLLLNVKNDATLIGATIHADKGLTATIGGNLTLESLQNLAYGSSKGVGVSGGVGYEGVAGNTANTTAPGQTGDAATANAGVSLSNGSYYTKETVLSSITSGGPLNIDVAGHTDITGALIASIDESGKDTGQLTLNTGSLSFTDLRNTHQSSDSTVSLNTNVLLNEDKAPEKGTTNVPQDSKGEDQPTGTTNLGIHQNSSESAGKTLATIGNGSITVGGETTTPEGLNRDIEEIDKELYAIDRVKGDLDLTVENKTIEEVAEAVVQVKREIQTWGEQAPKDIQVFIPGIESFIEEQIRKGVDVDDLMDTLKSPEFKAAVEKLKPLVELLENNPEQLQAALAEAKKITPDQISVNADGLTVIDIKGSKEIPIKTEVLHAMGILNQAVETVMQSESGQMVQLLAAALGGLPRLVASTAIDEIVGDELAELQKNAAIAIGAWGTGRSSAEFSEDVTDEQIYKDRNFFQTVEGGASLSMTLGNILLIGKAVDGKKDSSEGSAVSINEPRDGFTGPYNSNTTRADLEATHGADNVSSTTNPNNPVQTVNSNPEKGIEVIHGADGGKAVRVQYKDPVTGEPKTANIPYNDRGLPIFDDHAKYTTNIDHSLSYQGQMRQATRDLRDAINSGKVDKSQYTVKQLQQIQSGSSTIDSFTWHHNADSGNMQLIPKEVHNAVRHTGQGALNQGK
jgi:hypothetical protein